MSKQDFNAIVECIAALKAKKELSMEDLKTIIQLQAFIADQLHEDLKKRGVA